MVIRNMFADDINRKINGVIKVDQSGDDVIEQELKEYVITRELKKHFITFFNNYVDALSEATADTGVWISGFFGSGKSHFLKMLAYILENREIGGTPAVEYFRQKFEDDPATFMLIDQATKVETETILFNIDIEGPMIKDKTAVLQVFAKMFYSHLGFYGDKLKVAMMEQYLAQQGKLDTFRHVFAEVKGQDWEDCRRAFEFNKKAIIPALVEALDMSEEDARDWLNDKSKVDFSISRLVQDIKDYLKTKPQNFRLLFMVDEVGQYVGTDTDMLLNLQSLVEKIGSECQGRVWVVCTGQEAIDEIIKVRADEFSRIQARFKTRLSLSSSSVDEVIQKRILRKTKESEQRLETVYDQYASDLRNLFTFENSQLDIKGYTGPQEYAVNFPFVPYQFIIMQKVFAEIRKHGNSGKHLSGGERSMLSGFQEAAQAVQEKDEHALVPFFHFYDTVHTFLDGSIRRVIERCEKAAENHDGIEEMDVQVLKLLYLIRYVDDIPGNINNVAILMADDLRMDKIEMREKIRSSLERLMSQNYIGRTGDVYNFLTDEEQDIQREIKNTIVDTASIVERLGQIIFSDIFTTKKYRYGRYDFPFDQMVDGMNIGPVNGGMRLRFLTVATDVTEKAELRLMNDSKNGEAIVVLGDTPYYEALESALKVRKYVKQRNVSQMPKSAQDIIRDQQDEAQANEAKTTEALIRAIENAQFYVDGEHIEIRGGTAKSKIDQALQYLVTHVYSELGQIQQFAETDEDIIKTLTDPDDMIAGMEYNRNAAAMMEEYLEMQRQKNLPTSMSDIQDRYSNIPYGWREIDIAAVAAMLIHDQKVTIKYGGETIRADNPKLPDMLRKKSEIGKTSIGIHVSPSAAKMRAARELLRDYFEIMDVPSDENGLISLILERFGAQRAHYVELSGRYEGHHYPDRGLLDLGVQQIDKVLSQKKDNIALIDALLKYEDNLFDCKEQLQRLEGFFKNQVQVFDAAAELEASLRNDVSYLHGEPEADEALNKIRLITTVQTDAKTIYRQIPELNALMDTVRAGHDRLLDAKRAEVQEVARQCLETIHGLSNGNPACKELVTRADAYYDQRRQDIATTRSLALLDGLMPPMWSYKDDTQVRMEAAKQPPKPPVEQPAKPDKPVKKNYKPVYRQSAFPAKTLQSREDIDSYVEQMRAHLVAMLDGCDGITLK